MKAFVVIVITLVVGITAMDTAHESTPRPRNRLAEELSPYLLQHADNPVEWYPWSEEAFAKARAEDKPIFLSIGYSTCHWCHVMEHESFENPATAELLNDAFVCIKVDREERPDIDQVYMAVCQMLTGSGGWPLTIIMTPERKPFFAGTYIPPHTRMGLMGLDELVPRVQVLWREQREQIENEADRIAQALRGHAENPAAGPLDPNVLDIAYGQMVDSFDEVYGGFGMAPKFPTPHVLRLLLRHYERTGSGQALKMVETTLKAMRQGGIYDHVGLGFHRYSTDQQWLVPHFEKMLYDQALLLLTYLEAYQATGKSLYAQTAREIASYVLAEMTAPLGGFYSAQDADSEGVEGKYYVWTLGELQGLLDEAELAVVEQIFDVSERGNFALELNHGSEQAVNILSMPRPMSKTAATMDCTEQELGAQWEPIRLKLLHARQGRVGPHKDDKILTDWNGLMIAALARAGWVLNQAEYVQAAETAAAFIKQNLTEADGQLLHRYRNGGAGIQAHAEDYAFMIWGLSELYQASHEPQHLQWALQLQGQFHQGYWDEEHGGYFLTADDAEQIIVRPKEVYDGAIPSANSVALTNLVRLTALTGDPQFLDHADMLQRSFSEAVSRVPMGHTHFLIGFAYARGPSREIVIAAGTNDDAIVQPFLQALRTQFLPRTVVVLNTPQTLPGLKQISPFSAAQLPQNDGVTVYVCTSQACQKPISSVAEMFNLLRRP